MANATTACFMTQGTGFNQGQLITQIEMTADK